MDFISKPIQEAEVLARVSTHLQLRNTQLHLEELVAERTAELEVLLRERSEALSSAETQIAVLFRNSPLGIGLSSYDGAFLSANSALLRMLCISEEEMLQHNVTEFYLDPIERSTLLREVQATGFVQNFGVQLVRNDGSTFSANMNLSQLVLKDNNVLLAMVEDVTEQLTAEQELAIIEERSRLARELHDAVSQTLFSASLLADTIPRIWEKDQAIAKQNLDRLGGLLRGALAEMRTLLFELLPDVMKNQTLGQLVAPLVESARARTRAQVQLTVKGDDQLPEDITSAFFRIVQEALNNVARHAEATEVNINVVIDPQEVVLRVTDDGRGFDPAAIPPGHLGIGIMANRAQKIGATFKVDSEPGGGTEVIVDWQIEENVNDRV